MRAIRFALLLGMLFSFNASGQSFPSRPVTFIVPWPPGGSTDYAALAKKTYEEEREAVKRLNLKM